MHDTTSTARLVGATADIDWDSLSKDVTYQLYTPSGWRAVTRDVYRTIRNPANRRVLLKQERKTFNSELFDVN
jgi:hypothetical protein